MSQISDLAGIGMTSKRTRLRLVQRLRDGGITNERVLSVMAEMPRHIFLDEALAHRAEHPSRSNPRKQAPAVSRGWSFLKG